MNHDLGLGIFLLSTGMCGTIVVGLTKPDSLTVLVGIFVMLLGSIGIARAFPKKP